MSVSSPFIHRPIATSLLGLATVLGGALGYFNLPVSSLPQVDFPTIQVSTQLPGANPQTMSTLVTASLERELGQIPALSTMTSTSAYGLSQITLQFNLGRDIDAAAQDVQSAINAAGSTLPRNLPYPPTYSKVNPADAAIVTLALTSNTVSMRDLSDFADTLIAQRLSTVTGVGHVSVEGGIRPAVRIDADVTRLASLRPEHDGPEQRHRRRQRRGPEGIARRHAAVLHYRRQRPDRVGRGLSRHRRGLPQRRARAPEGCCQRRGGSRERQRRRLVQWHARRHRRCSAPARRQRHRDRRPAEGGAAAAGTCFAAERQAHPRARPHRHHPRFHPRRAVHALPERRARRARGAHLPQVDTRNHHRRRRAPRIAYRDLRRDVVLRLQPRQPLFDGADDRHRLCRRRRHRHDREHRAPHREGRAAAAGSPRRRTRDRIHGHLADDVADRGVHPAAVHDRARRSHVQRVRADADDRGRGLGHRVADADADDVRPAPEAARGAEN